MGRFFGRGGALLLFVSSIPAVAVAQQAGSPANHALNPSLSLTAPASSPLQQQIQQNYRTQLLGAQREMQQANPAGISPEQLQIGNQLNSYNAAPH